MNTTHSGGHLSEIRINKVSVKDLRFPTSRGAIGSDAVNIDPDYSAAYCILETNCGLIGCGLTFTLGRGTELCVQAVEYLAKYIRGRTLGSITENFASLSRELTGDPQFRWLGPEKGVIHLATAALINAVWDLYARSEEKPLWRLLMDMEPEQIINAIDFRYIEDVLPRSEAIDVLRQKRTGVDERLQNLMSNGYPAYTTSVGWMGYDDEKIVRLCRESLAAGWTDFKLKVGGPLEDDLRRAGLVRAEIGPTCRLMLDANQKWNVEEAIRHGRQLLELDPWWLEEPTNPDDVFGHLRIRRELRGVRIATGEHCQNRVMFKQFFLAGAIDICQIDSCRLAGVNECLAVIIMAAKFGIPVCPHAGGVGLCEYVQHLSIFDYLCVSATLENREIEFVDHLHEHFIDPVRIRNGKYLIPENPGYSIEIYPDSLRDFNFPTGAMWSHMR
jgi:L-fuconate dehydratase